VRLFDEVFEEARRGEVADLDQVKRREVNGPDVRGGEVRDLEAMDNLTIQEISSSGWLQAVLRICDILVRIQILLFSSVAKTATKYFAYQGFSYYFCSKLEGSPASISV
jgi:hypothetical protein